MLLQPKLPRPTRMSINVASSDAPPCLSCLINHVFPYRRGFSQIARSLSGLGPLRIHRCEGVNVPKSYGLLEYTLTSVRFTCGALVCSYTKAIRVVTCAVM